jgi:hypothetical protein
LGFLSAWDSTAQSSLDGGCFHFLVTIFLRHVRQDQVRVSLPSLLFVFVRNFWFHGIFFLVHLHISLTMPRQFV